MNMVLLNILKIEKVFNRPTGQPANRLTTTKAMAMLEYAVLISVVSTALLVMYVYSKRGLQAVIKQATDHSIGSQADSQPRVTSTLTDSNSRIETVADDRTRVSGQRGGIKSSEFDSESSSFGNSLTVTETY